MSKLFLPELERKLWDCANVLRGSIDSSEYKDYIFGLMFLKRVSDVFLEQREKIEDAFKNDKDEYDFFIPQKALFEELLKHNDNIGEQINKSLELIEEENPILEGVLVSIDYNEKHKLSDEALKKLLNHMNFLNLRNDNIENPDILGQAYEYMIKKFADDSGKKGGEFYTPKEVVSILTHTADIKEGMKIADWNCGSGGILVSCVDELKRKGLNYKNLTIHGQEKNRTTWAIAKLNMFLHNIMYSRIEHGDSMINSKLVEGGELLKYDRVLANPMWNQKEWGREQLEKGDAYGRKIYGLPPKSSGDWMRIQHMFKSLNSTGKLGVVLDNGVLFRSGAEGEIRKGFLTDDFVECIIGLPSNLFYNVGVPGCIVIINKNKPEERKGKVLFIDGSREFEEGKKQNKLKPQDVEKITNAYLNFKVIEKYSYIADLSEIEENDFNLNITRYIDSTEVQEEIDVNKVYSELQVLYEKREQTKNDVDEFMKELGFSL